jgi:hypothetical protein
MMVVLGGVTVLGMCPSLGFASVAEFLQRSVVQLLSEGESASALR